MESKYPFHNYTFVFGRWYYLVKSNFSAFPTLSIGCALWHCATDNQRCKIRYHLCISCFMPSLSYWKLHTNQKLRSYRIIEFYPTIKINLMKICSSKKIIFNSINDLITNTLFRCQIILGCSGHENGSKPSSSNVLFSNVLMIFELLVDVWIWIDF